MSSLRQESTKSTFFVALKKTHEEVNWNFMLTYAIFQET